MVIHGTNYLIARDNVGYRSKGHGFYLEDGTEVYNVLDRNLAVGARPIQSLDRGRTLYCTTVRVAAHRGGSRQARTPGAASASGDREPDYLAGESGASVAVRL